MYCSDCNCNMCELWLDSKQINQDVSFFTKRSSCGDYTEEYKVIKYVCPKCGKILGDIMEV